MLEQRYTHTLSFQISRLKIRRKKRRLRGRCHLTRDNTRINKVHAKDVERGEEGVTNIIFYQQRAISGIIVALAAIIPDIRRLRDVEIITRAA